MRPETAIERLRDAIAASEVHVANGGPIRAVHYPYRVQLNGLYPCLELFWDETVIEHAADSQTWLMTVRGQLLTAAFGDSLVEVPKVDPVLADLVDLFDASNPGAFLLEAAGSAERASHCLVTRLVPSAFIAYMSDVPNHYGAEIFWSVKLRRFAGD